MAKRLRKKGAPRYLGVDPGKEGYLCVLDEHGEIKAMWPIPYLDDRPDLARLVKLFRAIRLANCVYVLVEHQQPFAKEGPVGAFSSGFGYGTLLTCLQWSGLRFRTIRPDPWKRLMGIPAPVILPAELPPKPATKKAQTAWKKVCDKLRARVTAKKRKERKRLACALAQKLAPDYDFRISTRARKPHDGKCESFLIARLAYETATRGED